jgi:hypothetical protein
MASHIRKREARDPTGAAEAHVMQIAAGLRFTMWTTEHRPLQPREVEALRHGVIAAPHFHATKRVLGLPENRLVGMMYQDRARSAMLMGPKARETVERLSN